MLTRRDGLRGQQLAEEGRLEAKLRYAPPHVRFVGGCCCAASSSMAHPTCSAQQRARAVPWPSMNLGQFGLQHHRLCSRLLGVVT